MCCNPFAFCFNKYKLDVLQCIFGLLLSTPLNLCIQILYSVSPCLPFLMHFTHCYNLFIKSDKEKNTFVVLPRSTVENLLNPDATDCKLRFKVHCLPIVLVIFRLNLLFPSLLKCRSSILQPSFYWKLSRCLVLNLISINYVKMLDFY